MKYRLLKTGSVKKWLLGLNMAVALIYFSWWLVPSNADNKLLYGLLFIGEIYHLFMAFSLWHTIWPNEKRAGKGPIFNPQFIPSVDLFITVAGEPVEVLRKTIRAAKNLDYPNIKIYVLNDGFVAKKENWEEVEKLAQEEEIFYITRRIPGGAKAGNVNNALKLTRGDLVALFDTDMVPKRNFLKKIVPFFQDPEIGFVQSPQYYKNWRKNKITFAALKQQELFFGPIMKGKERSNSAFICGTNFVIRRDALEEAGGMREDNIAEDFLTSMAIHKNGWRSKYLTEVLCKGLAPEDLMSYFKQQLRWARGSLEVIFSQNPLFIKSLSNSQKLEYLASAAYYLNGVVVFTDTIMPLIYLYTGIRPVSASSTSFALFFIPFMFLNLFTLNLITRGKIDFRAIALSQSSWSIQLLALRAVLLKQKTSFSVTPKQALEGNYKFLAYPHIAYLTLGVGGSVVGIAREGFNSSIVTNLAWVGVNIALFLPFISAALNPKFEKKIYINNKINLNLASNNE